MTISELKDLMQSGKFHHATYRNLHTIWEGLYIYAHDPEGFRGYRLVDAFGKDAADLKAAEDLLAGTGISLGAYGQG